MDASDQFWRPPAGRARALWLSGMRCADEHADCWAPVDWTDSGAEEFNRRKRSKPAADAEVLGFETPETRSCSKGEATLVPAASYFLSEETSHANAAN